MMLDTIISCYLAHLPQKFLIVWSLAEMNTIKSYTSKDSPPSY